MIPDNSNASPTEDGPAEQGAPTSSTRRVIDEAALDLFAELGYHAASMRQIAAAANVKPASLYHWYPSKEAILVHMQDSFLVALDREVRSRIAGRDDPVHRLAAAVREHVRFHGLHRRAAFVTDTEVRALGPDTQPDLLAKRDAYQNLFNDLITDGIDSGAFTCSDASVATYAILLECTGVAVWFNPDGPLDLDRVAEIHIELVLASLRTDPAAIAEAIEATRPA